MKKPLFEALIGLKRELLESFPFTALILLYTDEDGHWLFNVLCQQNSSKQKCFPSSNFMPFQVNWRVVLFELITQTKVLTFFIYFNRALLLRQKIEWGNTPRH